MKEKLNILKFLKTTCNSDGMGVNVNQEHTFK